MTSETTHHKPSHKQPVTLAWNEIKMPGSYVALNGSTLYRIPEDALTSGHSPVITTISSENGYGGVPVAKLSSDPNITLTKARQICADSNIHPDF